MATQTALIFFVETGVQRLISPKPPEQFGLHGVILNLIGLRTGATRPDVWRLIEESERGRAGHLVII